MIFIILLSGEKCDVRLEVQLESPLEQLYDILVLHLEGGKDVFITVTGKCQRTCFTTAFSALCRAPVPIAHLSPEQLAHAVSRSRNCIYKINFNNFGVLGFRSCSYSVYSTT